MNNTCFSKKLFDTLNQDEKTEYMKNNMFFCGVCENTFNIYLIIMKNHIYDKNKKYYSIMRCKYHRNREYPTWFS